MSHATRGKCSTDKPVAAVALLKTLVRPALAMASFTVASSCCAVLSGELLLLIRLFSVATRSLTVAFGGKESAAGPPMASIKIFVASCMAAGD